MRKTLKFLAVAVAMTAISTTRTMAQAAPAAGTERKVSARVAPVYPELAKRMHIHGIVRIEAIVRPNGTVKSTRVLGGNPVLVDAAQEAVGKWKFEPTQAETTEPVQLTFDGQ
jgi:TonB family protein